MHNVILIEHLLHPAQAQKASEEKQQRAELGGRQHLRGGDWESWLGKQEVHRCQGQKHMEKVCSLVSNTTEKD